jgi:HlyD family secretion protein
MPQPIRLLLTGLIIVIAGAAAYWWVYLRPGGLPAYITSGNGRIEADEVRIATKLAGRLDEVLVHEGDFVGRGQVVARMDTSELEAQLAEAAAQIARAREETAAATARITQRQGELTFAKQELDRVLALVKNGHATRASAESRQVQYNTAVAALAVARAELTAAQHAVTAAIAASDRIKTQIDDSRLVTPIAGRVQYRLAEPGEVLAAGGRVATVLDLTQVHMTIFLPTAQAGRVAIGAEARLVLDAYPQYVIPASVSFVAAEAQFTPREVETRAEREKLMFRVKVKLPPALLEKYLDRVKVGLPGEAYVRLEPGEWPPDLAVRLPAGAS